MTEQDKIIFVPGVGDDRSQIHRFSQEYWKRKWHTEPIIHKMPWKGTEPYAPKLERLLTRVDSLTSEGYRVSLVGSSAGSLPSLTAFTLRNNDIHKVVTICGPINREHQDNPRLARYINQFPSLGDAVHLYAEHEQGLQFDDRRRILNIYPRADEVVPVSAMMLEGSCSARIGSVEHMLNILAGLTTSSRIIYDFISEPYESDYRHHRS